MVPAGVILPQRSPRLAKVKLRTKIFKKLRATNAHEVEDERTRHEISVLQDVKQKMDNFELAVSSEVELIWTSNVIVQFPRKIIHKLHWPWVKVNKSMPVQVYRKRKSLHTYALCHSSYRFSIQVKPKEYMYIKWEKPSLNQQVKYINLTLSL